MIVDLIYLFILSNLLAFVECVPTYTYRVINQYPHDSGAFTQGLQYVDGIFYEGTGLYGSSSIRKVNITTGAVLQSKSLSSSYFGEGIVVLNKQYLYQLTWQEGVIFKYNATDFELVDQFNNPSTEGW